MEFWILLNDRIQESIFTFQRRSEIGLIAMAAAEEGFNNAAVTEIEEKSEEEFLSWVHKIQNAVATSAAGGTISKPARRMMCLAINEYITVAKILREISSLGVSATEGNLTRRKKREILPMIRDCFEIARKQFNFARINMKVHSLLNHYI